MTIVVTALLVTSVWVFLAAVLGGCGGKDSHQSRDADNVFTGEFWLWERREGAIRLRSEAGVATRMTAGRPAHPVVPSPTA